MPNIVRATLAVAERGKYISVIALVCCFNRRERTLRIVEQIDEQASINGYRVSVILVDDGSSDGTYRAIRDAFPQVELSRTSGGLYWARSMRLAMDIAALYRPDYLLWLNDDVCLASDAIARILAQAAIEPEPVVLVGATTSSSGDRISYSGMQRVGRGALSLRLVAPQGHPVEVDTMNGNVVLLPTVIVCRVGLISADYSHGIADVEYGYRVRKHGYAIRLLGAPVGTCDRNDSSGSSEDVTLPRITRIKLLFGPKGMPLIPNISIERHHGEKAWLARVVLRYMRAVARIAFNQGPRRSIEGLD